MAKDTWQVILGGEGGQGLIVAGMLLAEAASIYENRFATLTQSYGIATRGGFVKAEVIISPEEIVYPGVEQADVVVALSQEALQRTLALLGPGGMLFFDLDLVDPAGLKPATVEARGLPFTAAAAKLGNPGAANVVCVGAVATATGMVGFEALRQNLESRFKGEALEGNLKALRHGRKMVAGT